MQKNISCRVSILTMLISVFGCFSAVAQLPDKHYPSVERIRYVVEVRDTVTSPRLTSARDLYRDTPGVFTFRGSSRRDMPQSGRLDSVPSRIEQVWCFKTACDMRETKYGVWGGGSGWTGQPLYVEWPDSLMERQRKESKGLKEDFSKREIIVGTLAGYVYFIDYETGRASRVAHKSGNPIKGTISLDPRLNGNLYIGQGIPAEQPFGAEVFNLYRHKRISFFGPDYRAWKGWGAYDSSPIVVDNFVIRASENGTIYKLTATDSRVRVHSLLRYRQNGYNASGIESSPAVWQNYLYTSDNKGSILCVNIETMKPVWHYDNRDDTDASLVLAEEGGRMVIYSGSEVDKQGDSGYCRFIKLDALSGERIWERRVLCNKFDYCGKKREAGMFSTPLLGGGDCKNMIFTNICSVGSSKGSFVAIDRETGAIIYSRALNFYSWFSPVALYTPDQKMYIVTGDTIGMLYLIEASTGKIIYKMKGGNNFESSPVVVDNCFVVGSRGREIYKFRVY